MRLGASFSAYSGIKLTDPEAFIAHCRKHGYRAGITSAQLGGADRVREIRDALAKADIVIAEVGGWANCMDPRPEVRRQAIATTAEALAVADELGATSCINVVGSFNTEKMYGPHPENFSEAGFEATVGWVRQVLREVQPRRAKLVLEMAPWTTLDSPQVYRRIVEAVDHPGLGVHLDPANVVTSARLYYDTTKLLNECFDLLGPWLVGCHAKDILQVDPHTVDLQETAPGKGVLDYETFLRRVERVSPQLPVILEHLPTEAEYAEAAAFIRTTAGRVGATV